MSTWTWVNFMNLIFLSEYDFRRITIPLEIGHGHGQLKVQDQWRKTFLNGLCGAKINENISGSSKDISLLI
jgi:hypothetical protein